MQSNIYLNELKFQTCGMKSTKTTRKYMEVFLCKMFLRNPQIYGEDSIYNVIENKTDRDNISKFAPC